jgi:hypothetical protein
MADRGMIRLALSPNPFEFGGLELLTPSQTLSLESGTNLA